MEIFIAIFAFSLSVLFVFSVGFLKRWLFLPLASAFILRLSLSLMHRYMVKIPQGSFDARGFESQAAEWASFGCFGFFKHFDPSASYVYSSVLATFYACTERSVLAAQALNVFTGLISLCVIALITKKISGVNAARLVAWVLAVFPAMIIYSSVTLREVFVLLFFSLALYLAVYAFQKKNPLTLCFSGFFIFLASLFHGGMLMAIPALFVGYIMFSNQSVSKRNFYLIRIAGIFVLLFSFSLSYIFMRDMYIPKIGVIENIDAEQIARIVESRADGGAAYLSGMTVSGFFDILWQAPIRMFYFLFSPMPWQIRSIGHAFGMIDSMFYFFMAFLLFKHRDEILRRPEAKALVLIFFVLLVVFSFGTSNFGTAMRHRAKFGFILLIMTAPFFPRLRFLPWVRQASVGVRK